MIQFSEIAGVHVEPYDPLSPLVFLKTFTTDELTENILQFKLDQPDCSVFDL